MTDNLRDELEDRVRCAEEELRQAERELGWFNARPAGCVCDPREWGGMPGPVCSNFTPDPDPGHSGLCARCEHLEECHK
jgi:hypothetical protein